MKNINNNENQEEEENKTHLNLLFTFTNKYIIIAKHILNIKVNALK